MNFKNIFNLTVFNDFFENENYKLKSFENVQHFDLDGLKGRVLSSSYMPTEEQENFEAMMTELKKIVDPTLICYGKLDITFYRDDVRKSLHIANATDIPFSIENKKVVLIDDVLYTGRTIRAALDALLDFGRPSRVSLCVLVDRRFSRELPIQPDYAGKTIDTIISQKVKVCWKEKDDIDEVVLI